MIYPSAENNVETYTKNTIITRLDTNELIRYLD